DTAGIRNTNDLVERMGVERTKESIDDADLIIAMFDASLPFDVEDQDILDRVKDKRCLCIINKIDMPIVFDRRRIEEKFPSGALREISLKDGKGIDKVEKYIYDMVYSGDVTASDQPMVTNIRHEGLLKSSYGHLLDAREALKSG